MDKRIGKGVITAECRSDGASVASDLFANYPCRLHVTSRPNSEIIEHHTSITSEYNKDERKSEMFINRSKALTCYVLGYGGGLISGDSISLHINVKPNASLVVTSQSTSKAFKSIKGRDATFVKTQATVGKGGLLFLVPQPMQCFGGSTLEQKTEVILDGGICNQNVGSDGMEPIDPSLVLVDWYTGGRKNMDGGLWNMNSFHTTTLISYSKKTLFSSNDDDISTNSESTSRLDGANDLVFRDATRLSGGPDLVRHMRRFNIVCMVVLLGPRVKQISDMFLDTFSSRHIYDEKHYDSNDASPLNQNRGEGLNREQEGLMVSCGTFNTLPGSKQSESGIVVRLAADTLEIAGKIVF